MSPSERDSAILAAVRSGKGLRATGEEHGITHERVRQIVEELDPDAIASGMRVRAQEVQRARDARARPLIEKVCPVCEETFTTTDTRRVTDKPECARAWAKKLRHSGPERMADHQDRVARTTLRKPALYSPTKVRWALRHLERRGQLTPALASSGRQALADVPQAKAS